MNRAFGTYERVRGAVAPKDRFGAYALEIEVSAVSTPPDPQGRPAVLHLRIHSPRTPEEEAAIRQLRGTNPHR